MFIKLALNGLIASRWIKLEACGDSKPELINRCARNNYGLAAFHLHMRHQVQTHFYIFIVFIARRHEDEAILRLRCLVNDVMKPVKDWICLPVWLEPDSRKRCCSVAAASTSLSPSSPLLSSPLSLFRCLRLALPFAAPLPLSRLSLALFPVCGGKSWWYTYRSLPFVWFNPVRFTFFFSRGQSGAFAGRLQTSRAEPSRAEPQTLFPLSQNSRVASFWSSLMSNFRNNVSL